VRSQRVDFLLDERARQHDAVGADQRVERASLRLGAQPFLELALHVVAHLAAQRARAARETEAVRERVVELGQLPLFDFLEIDYELRRLAGQALRRIVLRERHRRGRAVAGFVAAQRCVEVLEHLPGPDDDPDTFALAALERLAVDRAREIDGHAVAFGGAALDDGPRRTLAPQLLDHRVEIGLLDVYARHVDRELSQVLQRELGVDLERGAIGEVLGRSSVGAGERLDTRPAGRIQLLLLDRARVGRADDVRHDLVADLPAVILTDDFLRHLARPEALQLRRLAHLGQPRGDRALDLGVRHADRQPPFQPRRSLQ